MKIEKVHIKGFRNFEDEEIVFQPKTLIIGANDVGKTNLLYALRILFDKSISEHDLELNDSDYNAYSNADTIEITATICDVTEDCLLSTFGGAIKDGSVIIRYTNSKNGQYSIWMGYNEEVLAEYPTRQYIKRLNMQYVDTNRDLFKFLKQERMQILQISKELLKEEQKEADEEKTKGIQNALNEINNQINSLNYVLSALENVNTELAELSADNEDQKIRFIAGESDAGKLLDNLTLSFSTGNNLLSIGGDGRNNQIFLATWIAKQNIQKNVDHVTFYAVEEPEAHLHPHQQRKLSTYIQEKFGEQIFITTHSSHIAAKFTPANILRLYTLKKKTYAASGGCSDILKEVFENFGYRMNALSAECFFASGVFLVEGVSEVLFYTALSNAINVDLDRLNITILSVEGVGFKPYIAVCDALNIPWVMRTDNDVFAKPSKKPEKNYYAGVSRIMGILSQIENADNELIQYWAEHNKENEWAYKTKPTTQAIGLNKYIRENITSYGIYLSNVDLETDLAQSSLYAILKKYYGKRTESSLVKAMQKYKAKNMMNFLSEKHSELGILSEDDISKPLISLKNSVEERIHPEHE
ncbi:AAA family ATPase [Faecalicatena fissicatena]|jgi:putative ATP-dependent endonuclease of OLD family|uniref:ATP-dependent nuclease n=1 Tax=Faecalicatena fissicatena TaxID=290055 RepID=UPI001570B488|nr:AAA family ATPase [Faecalicatena fissicatena]NSE34260.1 AAA family ATPase [Faecalicatena fissicatena]